MKGSKRKEEDRQKRAVFLEAIELIGQLQGVTKISEIVSKIFDNRAYSSDKTEKYLEKEKSKLTNSFYSIKNDRSVPYDGLAQELLDAFDSEELYNLLSQNFNIKREGEVKIEDEIKDSIPKLLQRIEELKGSIVSKQMEYDKLTEQNEQLISLVIQLGKDNKNDKELKEAIEALKKYREG